MKTVLSKQRDKKILLKEKRSVKTAQKYSLQPLIALLIGVFTWFLLTIITIFPLKETFLATIFDTITKATFIAISTAAFSGLLLCISAELIHNTRYLLLLSFSVLLSALITKGLFITVSNSLSSFVSPIFLSPFILVPLISTILIGKNSSIPAGFLSSFIIGVINKYSITGILNGLLVSILVTESVKSIRSRKAIFKIGFIGFLSQIPAVLLDTVSNYNTIHSIRVISNIIACFTESMFSSILVLLGLPVLEFIFNVVSDISLLELSDMTHPLLQRLAIEAPGTYHHSLIVSSIAQAAAEEINANSLLARVAAYYHDIGKLTKPSFFTENIGDGPNPHDELPPSISKVVIIAHVKDGIALAKLHRIPQPIIDIISEHHGTFILSYFLHKAKIQMEFEQNKPVEKIENLQDDFRYPGPKPSTKESAIIFLADAVEAASRSLEKNTPVEIEEMVEKIIMERLTDGQLDNCKLTITELKTIKKSFVFSLVNILHGRIQYPRIDETQTLQSTEDSKNQ